MKDHFNRPDPDRLLDDIIDADNKRKRGRLKIFFGMAAGVGKTFAMLEASHRLILEGKKVLVGYVETHGRQETTALTNGLEILPRKKIDYNGFIIEEFDIDEALSISPDYLVIDELAHSNAEGSRHFKRYQDVQEILDNGISVLSTLNIQHLESQADIVEKITGVKIRETLPDSILDQADEIELVDIPTEELLKRLSEGKVYVPEKAEVAAANFFKKSNITALRELALHYVANKVDEDLQNYTRKKDIRGAWKSGEKILVAVSPSPYSEYLIRWTRRMASNTRASWVALYIEKDKELSVNARAILQKNLSLARELGAEVISTSDEDVISGLLRISSQKNITQIIVGKPLKRYLADYLHGGNLVERLIKRCGDIEIHIVTQPNTSSISFFSRITVAYKSSVKEYLIGVGAVLGVTLANLMMVSFVGYWTIALVYLLCVALIALRIGRGPVLVASALSAVSWNFLFIPPLHTFRIDKLEDILMFMMYFIIAMILGGLTSKLRIKESALRKREKRISDLYELSNMLSSTRSFEDLISSASIYIKKYLNMDAAFFTASEPDKITEHEYIKGRLILDEKDRGVVDWVYKNNKTAGLYTNTLPRAGAYFIPLSSTDNIVGVIALRPESFSALSPEIENFIQNVVFQIAMHIEHEILSQNNRKSLMIAESERLYKVLLNTISHELRTPLTAISGASSCLLDDKISENIDVRKELSLEIHKAADRLNHLVDNLLDMSRLESGMLKLNKKLNDIGELISVSVRRLEKELADHILVLSIDENIPPIYIDFTLMEQALTNLIYNAVSYTPAGSKIEIAAISQNSFIKIELKDNGPGLSEEDIPYLFDKFRRGAHVSAGGTGLGLSICKGIIEAHGGMIRAMNRADGGAQFLIELPI
ncbi:MAG: sensor histidine kinase KdpD [Spirochaetes bacterium]|nr:sensor histidine kinase KdpD [Spirochaetota bacterium]